MAVYVIVNVEVKDPTAYQRYLAEVPGLIAKHGGEYLVRGGKPEVLEGTWNPSRVVVLRFSDRKSAMGFMEDPEYRPLKELRHRVARSDIVVVEGIGAGGGAGAS